MRKKLFLLFKNFYFLVGLFFLVWMLFLDDNNLISRFKMSVKLHALESSKTYYQQKIGEVKKDHEELMTDKILLEKFAREKYLMKKDNEDIFVIQSEQ